MIYIALLRGINVGGNNKVDMKELKAVFEAAGMESVRTYLNTGNVIFKSNRHKSKQLVKILETSIHSKFNLPIKVLILDLKNIETIVKAIPSNWKNDKSMKCDVMFLWEPVNKATILDELAINPKIDSVKYVPGAILWSVDRRNVTKSGMMKLVGTKLYSQMTIRNCNTARKVLSIMQDLNLM